MNIFFVALSNIFDDSNGAAVATRTLLDHLKQGGHNVSIVCSSLMECAIDSSFDLWLRANFASALISTEYVEYRDDNYGCPVMYNLRGCRFEFKGIPTVMYLDFGSYVRSISDAEFVSFLALSETTMQSSGSDLVLSYGSHTRILFRSAKRLGAKTVFLLHSLAYKDVRFFDFADHLDVPSVFGQAHYRETLGVECIFLPNTVDPERVYVESANRKYITMVNPSVEKGVNLFAQLVDAFGAVDPLVKFLAVEARGGEHDLAACGIDLRLYNNLRLMSHTKDPKKFWSLTKICVVPSLVNESQGLVALEAMINGIPVLVSDRGALSETVGPCGFVLAIPEPNRLAGYGGQIYNVQFQNWIDAISSLVYDIEKYRDASLRSRKWALSRVAANDDSVRAVFHKFATEP